MHSNCMQIHWITAVCLRRNCPWRSACILYISSVLWQQTDAFGILCMLCFDSKSKEIKSIKRTQVNQTILSNKLKCWDDLNLEVVLWYLCWNKPNPDLAPLELDPTAILGDATPHMALKEMYIRICASVLLFMYPKYIQINVTFPLLWDIFWNILFTNYI